MIIFSNKFEIKVNIPKMEYCTDNAAMIAMAGYFKLKKKEFSDLSIEPNPNIIYK